MWPDRGQPSAKPEDGNTVTEVLGVASLETTDTKSFLGAEFALTYEASAERLTGAFSRAALAMVGGIGPGVRVLDVAAGTGQLSVPAAEAGAHVLGTDLAPGMVARMAERLRPYPDCKALVMDGEQLNVADDSFDVAFSIFGVIVYSDWRKGLRELARVVRPGGQGCVATWGDPRGGGPFVLLTQALQSVFPDRPSPPPREAFQVLSSPDTLVAEMHAAGFDGIEVKAVEAVWASPVGDGYIADTEDLYSYIPPYARLSATERDLVRAKLIELADESTVNGRVELHSTALIAVGRRI